MVLVLAFSIVNSGLNSLDSETRGVETGWRGIDSDMAQIVEALGDDPGRIWSEDATVMNYLEWARVPVTYDMRPEICLRQSPATARQTTTAPTLTAWKGATGSLRRMAGRGRSCGIPM